MCLLVAPLTAPHVPQIMGNALSGSEKWPVRHDSAKVFGNMTEGDLLTVGAGCYWYDRDPP